MRRGSSGMSPNKAASYLSGQGYPDAFLEFSMTLQGDSPVATIRDAIVVENNLVLVDTAGKKLIVLNADFSIRSAYNPVGANLGSQIGCGCYYNGKLYIGRGAIVEIYNITLDEGDITDITYSTSFGSEGTGDGQFTIYSSVGVGGLATDGEYIYASDWGGHRLQKFTLAGVYMSKIGSLGSGDDQFNRPCGMKYYDGKIYACEATGARVNIRNQDLSYSSKFNTAGAGNGQINGVYDIHVDASGIYVGESTNARVQKFDASWNYVAKYAPGSAVSGVTIFGGRVVIVTPINTTNTMTYVNNTTFAAISSPFQTGTDGIFMPRITYDTSYTGRLISTDGSIDISLPSDCVPGRDLADIWATVVWPSQTINFRLLDVPKSAVQVVSSLSAYHATPWAKYQTAPVCALGNYPSIWYDGSTYHAYYAYDSYSKIGHATSADGITFTEDSVNNPLISKGPGTYDDAGVAVATVWQEGATWYMLYRGDSVNTCLATSEDGLAWTKYAGNPVILGQADPAGLMKVGSTYYLYANTTGGNREVNVWTSADLHTWTLQTPDPLIAGYRYCSCPFKFGAKYYLFVSTDMGKTIGSGIELFECDDPTFIGAKCLGFVVLHVNIDGTDTPSIPTDTIFRDTFPDNKMRLYYAHGYTGTYTRPMFLAVQDDIAAGIRAVWNPFDETTSVLS